MGKFITIGERIHCISPVIRAAMAERNPDPILKRAEEQIAKSYDTILIHASLPAKKIYLKRGFKEVEYNILDTGYGDYLCFDKMEKNIML